MLAEKHFSPEKGAGSKEERKKSRQEAVNGGARVKEVKEGGQEANGHTQEA